MRPNATGMAPGRLSQHVQTVILTLLWLSGLLLGPAALALDSDRQQAIEINADRVDIDARKGQSHYSGHVRFTQGSLHIEADDITLQVKNGVLIRLLILGQPAVLTQTPEGGQGDIRAQARQMEYLAGRDQVILKGQAELRQGGKTFRSENIHYDLGNNTLSAGRAQDSGRERVHITIQPPVQPAAPQSTELAPVARP